MPRGGAGAAGIAVEAVTVDFGATRALDGVSLDVPRGEVTAVVGGDGAGKSTLLRVFANRVRPGTGSVSTLPREHIGYQPATSGVWANLSVRQNLEFVGRSYGMSARDIRSRGDELLERAALADARDRLGRALSGGMRQKLGFVLAMLHSPELVLLDEPSTGVDPVSRVELWRLISGIATDGTAVLMATTYLDEAQRAASVLALDGGRAIADGTPDEIIAGVPGTIVELPDEAPAGPTSWRRGIRRHAWAAAGAAEPAGATAIATPDLEDALIALTLAAAPPSPAEPVEARPAPPKLAEPVEARPAPPKLAEPVEARPAPPTLAEPVEARPAPSLRQAQGASLRQAQGASLRQAQGAIAEARHVTRRFGGDVAVDDVSLDVRPGEILGLIGANGAGKTTFLRMLIGLERPDEGEVELFGTPPDDAARRRMGYVPQGLGLFRTITVAQNAEFAARVYGTGRIGLPPSLADVSGAVVNDIGLGRQRQLAFALALGHEPELLVLDEPTSGVDPLARARLWDVIHEQASAGRGVIVTTHYLQEAEQCTRLALMAHGRLLGVGSVADLTSGTSAVLVRSDAWQQAFTALGDAGLPTMLSGRDIRVAGVPGERVREVLAAADVAASVDPVEPTLEETMVLLDRDAAGASAAAGGTGRSGEHAA
ncbi:ATP-binding cassette domain-containing protein [Agromyces larvae]|uniref:ATP-binding cassette domain-containing protein n=1 Tax=Agromyces larvae TaxID=2929802 RepID=A0ABY4BYR0_9MICO|nr:ATP-binding cassette domain-containing protein [Agromyces larvae]UOE43874.1 ATP-binding cassette domain-containing protein [Agromyces larvae]